MPLWPATYLFWAKASSVGNLTCYFWMSSSKVQTSELSGSGLLMVRCPCEPMGHRQHLENSSTPAGNQCVFVQQQLRVEHCNCEHQEKENCSI